MKGRKETINVEYTFIGENRQDAKIYFSQGQFLSCKYHVESLEYTIKDWKFLGALSKFILECAERERERFSQIVASQKDL